MATITGLNVFPVKSLRGIALDKAVLGKRGFRFDREWLVVDHRNRFVTQRDFAGMATIVTRLTGKALVLSHSSQPDLVIALRKSAGPHINVRIWKDHCDANDEGGEASRWLTAVLGTHRGQPLRLVRFARDAVRPVEPDFLAGDDAETGFADGYPYLIAVEESLHQLNKILLERGQQEVSINRFRANIIVRGLDACAENRVDELASPQQQVRLALRKPCQRCKITTIDQKTGQESPQTEPLCTLVAINPFPQPGGYFGQNAILLAGEQRQLQVGDVLKASYRSPANQS